MDSFGGGLGAHGEVLFYPHELQATMGQRIALVIGNGAYKSGPIENQVNVAVAKANQSQNLGFTVILKKTINLRGMEPDLYVWGK